MTRGHTNVKRTRSIDRLRLSDEQCHRLAARLDELAEHAAGSEHRAHTRYPYLVAGGLTMCVAGSRAEVPPCYLVRPRNISSGGLGFFHGAYLHVDTPCHIDLRTARGETVTVAARVVHCRHVTGQIHEVGAAFDTPIEVEPFLHGHEPDQAGSRAQFQGEVLCIEGLSEDRCLLKFQIGELGPTVTETGDASAAIELARSGTPDLIVLGESLISASPGDLAQALREAGCRAPLIQWSATRQPAAWSDGLLPKPFGPDDIEALLAAHLPPTRDDQVPAGEPLPSEFWHRPKLRPLLLNYLETLEEQVVRLEQCVNDGDTGSLLTLMRHIRSSAGSYGYPSISEAAEATLTARDNPSEIPRLTHAVVDLCRRACAFRAEVDCQRDVPANAPAT